MVNTTHLLKPEANMPYHVGVVGGSLAGLAAANILHRLGHSVQVYEKYPASLETRGSSLGYVDNALWEYVRGASMMRMGRRAHRSQGAYYYGDLWRFLYDGLPPDTVRFGVTVSDLGPSPTAQPTINGEGFDAVIIADGGFSSLRHYVNGDAQQPEYAGQVVFRTKVDRRDFPDFADEGGYMCPTGSCRMCDECSVRTGECCNGSSLHTPRARSPRSRCLNAKPTA